MESMENGNENTEYEKLAQAIYQCILKSEGFEHIKVEHDVKKLGKSGCEHQIDVYWEFTIGGITQRVAIECKNYTSEVSIGRIRDFFGVIHDLGNVSGIFVTKKGYQSGAKKYAEFYNINLKEVRFPKNDDWAGRIKTIEIEIHALPINITGRTIEPDYEWLIKSKKIDKIDDTLRITVSGRNDSVWVFDNTGEKIKNFYQLEEELPHELKPEKNKVFFYEYDDGYVDTEEFGRIKVKKIGFRYDIDKLTEKVLIEGEEITKAIIKDVKSGETKFIQTDGKVK